MVENPKIKDSGIASCRPQAGLCLLNCPECYMNGGHYYQNIDYSYFPTPEEVAGKVLRVNDGADSNNGGRLRLPPGHWLHERLGYRCERDYTRDELVKLVCDLYPGDKFWNTSIPRFDFPGPVVFTANGRIPLFVETPPNVMAVRIRYNAWEVMSLQTLAKHYVSQGVPILLTAMRYTDKTMIPSDSRGVEYQERKHVLNTYWSLRIDAQLSTLNWLRARHDTAGKRLVYMCGENRSSLCKDCGNCARLYKNCKKQLEIEG